MSPPAGRKARGCIPPRLRPAPPLRLAAPLLCLLACLLVLPSPSAAGDEPFTFPSNIGLTGLWEVPTARVMTENRYRLGVSMIEPYRHYYGSVGIFRRLEVSGRVTEVIDVPGPSGDVKDKAVDLKLQILREGKYFPAIAIAVLDPHGTRVYSSQAIVASKQVYPFDFTLGLGNGRLGGNPLQSEGEEFGLELFTRPGDWWSDARLFGGIQFAPSETFALAAEYSPISYHAQLTDPARDRYFREPVRSRINFGARWKPFRWAELDASFQRGNRIGVNLSVAFDIGKPLLPVYDPAYREPRDMRERPVEDRVTEALRGVGFSDIAVAFDGPVLRIEAQNDRYFFPQRAVEVILETLGRMEPPRLDPVRIVLKEGGIPLLQVAAAGREPSGVPPEEIPAARLREMWTLTPQTPDAPAHRGRHRRPFAWEIKPSFESFFNDPAGFYKYRLGVSGWARVEPWKGGALVAGVEGYPFNTVSSAAVPLSIQVRSDVADYKREQVALGRLLVEQIVRVPATPFYGRMSAGLLEVMYAGVDAEAAAPLFGGRILAGASGSLVRKREPDEPFDLKNDREFHTLFLNARLNVPEHHVWLDVKGGRFLAGDKGARFTLTKDVGGVLLSAWYGITDTSRFTDPFNDGYRDKGIAVEIPIRLFLGRDSRTAYRFALSPWTRDVAQDVDHYRTLFDWIGRSTAVHFTNGKGSSLSLQ